jgi:transposase
MNGKSIAMINQVREMHSQNHSIKKIALALEISRNTVRKYLREMSHKASNVSGSGQVDWKLAIQERSKGRPIKRIYEELMPSMSYSNFTRILSQHTPKKVTIAIRLNHEPGEKTQIDYGDGLNLYDRTTGNVTSTQFFCGVLPFSSYVFGEFTASQKLPDFIRSHV